jgi:hypothetical protein
MSKIILAEIHVCKIMFLFKSGVLPSFVRLGDLNLDNSVNDGATPKEYNIKRFIVHKDYKTNEKQNDIALIELDTSINFNQRGFNVNSTRPACLQQDENYNKTLVAVRFFLKLFYLQILTVSCF